MHPCNVCGQWTCSCALLGTPIYLTKNRHGAALASASAVMAMDPGIVGGAVTVTLEDGTVIQDVEFNMGSMAEQDQRDQERFAEAVSVVAQELAAGRAVMRLGDEQPVHIFGDRYTMRCFPRESDSAKEIIDGLRPGEVLVPRHDDDVHNWQILHALRRGFPAKLEGPFCRWCAGDGIDARHSNRVRALLERDSPRRVHLDGPRIQVVPGVAKGRPFNDWLQDMAVRAPLAVDDLLASIGRSEAELRCRRCMGAGR